eukprot:1888115-Pleurochrysis_carterae.AAC.1
MLTCATATRSGSSWMSCPIPERTRSMGRSTVSHTSLTSVPSQAASTVSHSPPPPIATSGAGP